MEEIEITHEESETVTEHSPDPTLSSPGHSLSLGATRYNT